MIVVVGDALIDELRDARGIREFAGGAALNVAVGLARLGHDVTLIAMVGEDADGDRIRTYLATFGVTLLASLSPLGTARAVSERVDGEPTYVFNAASRGRTITFGDDERSAIAAASAVVVSCMALDDPEQVIGLRGALSVSQAELFIDPNPRTGMMRNRDLFVAGFESLVPRAAVVKLGDDDAAVLYDAPVATVRERALELGARAVVTTLGSGGARVDGPVTVQRGIATLPGAIVDTMGAGDAVLASLVSSWASAPELDWAAALDQAMLIAAATVRHEGALLQVPPAEGAEYDRAGT